MIVTNPTQESINLSKRIYEFSAKYATGGQLGVVFNKVDNSNQSVISENLNSTDLEILGSIPYDPELQSNSANKISKNVIDAIKNFYFRLNLPQENR